MLKSALLEVTDKCNLNCKHCMNRPDFKNIETPPDEINKVFKKLSSYDVPKIYLSGGEPFAHRRIKDIILICGQYPAITFLITTNGLLLTEEIMTLIEQQKISRYNLVLMVFVRNHTRQLEELVLMRNLYKP